jgi:3-deoxy-D-manno-octulosonic-acid transferase
MYSIYSLLLTLGFLLMSPLFLLRREKYASGFKQRLGNYPELKHDGRKVIWLHCVSVGETNAARPLVDQLLEAFPDHRLIISTTTKTGQELAQKIFHKKADAVIFFPFDWKFSVRKALANYKPSLVLLMETEIWPRFIREAKLSSAKVAIVNGRLSERSFQRYSKVRPFIKTVLADVDLALMQSVDDMRRIVSLGIDKAKAVVTGNLKFDISNTIIDKSFADDFKKRFGLGNGVFTIVAASTHFPEEEYILDAFSNVCLQNPGTKFKLVLVPRHPERFGEVSKICRAFCERNKMQFRKRSSSFAKDDVGTDVVLLDTIGELLSVYVVADLVVVGGSMIPHGGQSVLEPASLGKPILVGPHTHNFERVISVFLENNALLQSTDIDMIFPVSNWLSTEIDRLFRHEDQRRTLSTNAIKVMEKTGGATVKTVDFLKTLLSNKLEADS